ncbi:MFS multidrug transporter [Aureobasidium pullulans]|nr:MFS multidrug transporter [Aureobasidium pullulans]
MQAKHEKQDDGTSRDSARGSRFIDGPEHEAKDTYPMYNGSNNDIEKVQRQPHLASSMSDEQDTNLVTWDGPEDPANPKNWTSNRKWAALLIVSMFNFISPVASAMIAPALTSLAQDLNIESSLEKSSSLSIFVLGYAIGPLFLGPLSELYGRTSVLQLANLEFLLFNLVAGFAKTKAQLIVFRFLAGLGGSAPQGVGGGVLSDLFTADERGRALSMYSLAPLLGPAIGPIAGGFIVEYLNWRWTFYVSSMADVAVLILGLAFLRESYGPILLNRKKKRLIQQTGNVKLHTEFDDSERGTAKTICTALIRPFRLLFTQPIIQLLAVYLAYLYGIMYLVLSSFSLLWTSGKYYSQPVGTSSLHYIAMACGLLIGAYICAPGQDKIYARFKHRNDGVGRPEFRVPLMIPSAFVVPVGLFIYGWTAEYRTFWIGPDIGVAIYSLGTMSSTHMPGTLPPDWLQSQY